MQPIHVHIIDPDDTMGMPIYDGPIDRASAMLVPGRYRDASATLPGGSIVAGSVIIDAIHGATFVPYGV